MTPAQYTVAEQETLVILPRGPRRAGRPRPVAERPPSYRLPGRAPVAAAAAVSALTLAVTAVSGDPAVLAGLAVAKTLPDSIPTTCPCKALAGSLFRVQSLSRNPMVARNATRANVTVQ